MPISSNLLPRQPPTPTSYYEPTPVTALIPNSQTPKLRVILLVDNRLLEVASGDAALEQDV